MINSNASKIKTYVGTDGKLHFVDSAGADTALNFSKGGSGNWNLSFKLTTSMTVNIDGLVLSVNENVTCTVNCTDGTITTKNTSVSGRATNTYHSNTCSAKVSNFTLTQS